MGINCYLPPYIVDELLKSSDPSIVKKAQAIAEYSIALRTKRELLSLMPHIWSVKSPNGAKYRTVYDLHNKDRGQSDLVIKEGDHIDVSKIDHTALRAYDNAGITYDFYKDVFGRNSLDDDNMMMVSIVHVGDGLNNAFWDGERMNYGDGDGAIFQNFVGSLEVVGHEMTHGVISYECNLNYEGQPGALNEHFADVFGSIITQWINSQTVDKADWLIGNEVVGPLLKGDVRALRYMGKEKAYENDSLIGTDPQPKHMDNYYSGKHDNHGVHINSGIPNYFFYLVAMELGGNSWDTAGHIWYEAVKQLNKKSNFKDLARVTHQIAESTYGKQIADTVKASAHRVGLSHFQ